MSARRDQATPLVSIVIPVFNGANYLAEAIDSALSQTWRNTEIIVVDDGSTDDGATRAVMARFGERIRAIHLDRNGGVAEAVNAGIAAMRGEYYSWLSHDDLFHPEKIARQVEALRHIGHPAMVFSDVDLVDEAGVKLPHRPDPAGDFRDAPLWAVMEGWINGGCIIVSRACIDACGPLNPGLPTTHDYDLWFRIARRFPVFRLPGRLATQRIHPQQESKSARHLDESSLLWTGFCDRLTTAEMTAMAGSPARFAERFRRFQQIASYRGGRLAAERLCRQFGAPGPLNTFHRLVRSVAPRRRRIDQTTDAALKSLPPPPVPPVATGRVESIRDAVARRRGQQMRPAIALVLHDMGGGSARFGAELAEILKPSVDVCFLRAHANRIEIDVDDRCADAIALGCDETEAVSRLLREFGVVRVFVLHPIGWGETLPTLLARLDIPFDLFLQDYHLVAETPHLDSEEQRFLGESALGSIAVHADPVRRFLLEKAERLFALSADLAQRLARLGLKREATVGIPPNTRAARRFQPRMPRLGKGEALRVLTLGTLRAGKGRDVLLAVAEMARETRARVEFHHHGEFLPAPSDTQAKTVMQHGIAGARLTDTVCWVNPHLAWFPFQLPETHSYVLSDAMSMGLPILSGEIGAAAERLAGRPLSWLLPWDTQPRDWLDFLTSMPGRMPADPMPVEERPEPVPELDRTLLLAPLRGAGC